MALNQRNQDSLWARFLPEVGARRDLYRAKLGAFKNTRKALSRRDPRWNQLAPHVKEDLLQCPCEGGQQDSYHLWHECVHSQHFLSQLLGHDSIKCLLPAHRAIEWERMGLSEKVKVVMAPHIWTEAAEFKRFSADIVTKAMMDFDRHLPTAMNCTLNDELDSEF